MTVAKSVPRDATSRMSLEEYLNYDDGTDARYELVDGALVEMGAESDLNNRIALFLLMAFTQFVSLGQLRNKTEVETPVGRASSRYPDLLVLSKVGAEVIAGSKRSIVRTEMPAPLLVVEVVSPGEPGEPNYDRDYVEKRFEYAALGISEYWIVDPLRMVVWVLVLEDGAYGEQRFEGEALVESVCFPGLGLTAGQVLAAGG